MKITGLVCFVVFFFTCVAANAEEEYVCNYGDEKRVISVVYESEQELVPCEVQYNKGEGVQTLWSAQSEVGYCENKAYEFIENQESWGWSCEKISPAVSPEDLHSALY